MLRAPKRHIYLDGRDQALCSAIGKLLPRQIGVAERDFYRMHLVCGGPSDTTGGRQRQMAILLDETLNDPDYSWSPQELTRLSRRAASRGAKWAPLAESLADIRATEQVLAPASVLFAHLLGMNGASVPEIVKRLQSEWGPRVPSVDAAAFETLKPKFAYDNGAAGDRWVRISQQLSTGDYEQLLKTLGEQNAAIMKDRGGIPWLELEQGKLRVHYRDERGELPPRQTLPTLWRFPYFLESLRTVSRACGGSGASE